MRRDRMNPQAYQHAPVLMLLHAGALRARERANLRLCQINGTAIQRRYRGRASIVCRPRFRVGAQGAGRAIPAADDGAAHIVETARKTGDGIPGRRSRKPAEDEVGVLRHLLPHLTNAIELTYRLAVAQSRSTSLAQLLDQLDSGVILTDAAARPLFLNARAEKIVGEDDGLTIQAAGLAVAAWSDTRRLRQAVAALAETRNGTAANGQAAQASAERRRLRLERPSLRPALMLTLVPIWRLGATPITGTAPAVAIFLGELAAPVRVDKIAVADAFQLMRREAEIAALIGEGHDLERIAGILDLSVATVRSHLKRVFGKTGTHRQSALASLVRELAEPRAR
jgi:DNA-binding CsgD family transcriptional regulator/PAS domain-containing protein